MLVINNHSIIIHPSIRVLVSFFSFFFFFFGRRDGSGFVTIVIRNDPLPPIERLDALEIGKGARRKSVRSFPRIKNKKIIYRNYFTGQPLVTLVASRDDSVSPIIVCHILWTFG